MKKIAIAIIVFCLVCCAKVSAQQLKSEVIEGDKKPIAIQFHTDFRLCENNQDFISKGNNVGSQAPWVRKIFKINGVSRVIVGQYYFIVFFAELFEAEDIVPKVEIIMEEYFKKK